VGNGKWGGGKWEIGALQYTPDPRYANLNAGDVKMVTERGECKGGKKRYIVVDAMMPFHYPHTLTAGKREMGNGEMGNWGAGKMGNGKSGDRESGIGGSGKWEIGCRQNGKP